MTDEPLPSRDAVVLGTRYRLIDRVGSGGTSVVWRAHDELLDRDVAVKLLNTAIDERLWPALRQEAKAVAQLASTHAAHMYDYGEWRRADGRVTPYLVMEFIDGVPLTRRLAGGQIMPWRQAATIVAEVCDALAAAHARDIVHRDIKPDNILLTASGVKVIDFGISAIVGAPDTDSDGRLLGTAAYVAPERLTGAPVSAPADVYAVGVLLYRALAGCLPWDADSRTAMLRAHLFDEPAELPPLQDGLPADLADLCYACLDKDPDLRPTAAEINFRATALLRPGASAQRTRRRWAPVAMVAALVVTATMAAAATHLHHGATVSATAPVSCTAAFSIDRDWGAGFVAVLTVTNIRTTDLRSPQVTFTFPGDQHLVITAAPAPVALDQQGTVVTATEPGADLRPRSSMTVPITATYRDTNPIPTQVNLNHLACVTTITGAAYRPAPASTRTPSLGPSGSHPTPTPVPAAVATATRTRPPQQVISPDPTYIPPPTTTPSSEPSGSTPSPSPSCQGKEKGKGEGKGKCDEGDQRPVPHIDLGDLHN